MIYATSDIHGYSLDSFLRLLEKAGFSSNDELYVIGDVIDRHGDGGIAMLRWMMRQKNVTLIMGNHEDMLLNCSFLFTRDPELNDPELLSPEESKHLARWNRNGSSVTIQSMLALKEKDPEELNKLLKYLTNAPLYIELTANKKRFVLVHGGLNGFSAEKGLDEYSRHDLVWTRPSASDSYWNDRKVILGHTPTFLYGKKGRMFATDTWVDIDTGAADGGSPMLLRLDDMKPFYAD